MCTISFVAWTHLECNTRWPRMCHKKVSKSNGHGINSSCSIGNYSAWVSRMSYSHRSWSQHIDQVGFIERFDCWIHSKVFLDSTLLYVTINFFHLVFLYLLFLVNFFSLFFSCNSLWFRARMRRQRHHCRKLFFIRQVSSKICINSLVPFYS